MKTSEKAKAAGLKNLNELAELTGRSTEVLRNWDKNNTEFFEIILKGAVEKKNQ